MKNRKVLSLRTHLGGHLSRTSYAESTKDEMELVPQGVLIVANKNGPLDPPVLEWAANCISSLVESDASYAKRLQDQKKT